MLFKKKPTLAKPNHFFDYTQAAGRNGLKHIKLSSYGYKPALDGISALSGKDLTGANIKLSVFGGDSPRIVVSIGKHHVGTIWKDSFDRFNDAKNGKIITVAVEISNGESYLYYK